MAFPSQILENSVDPCCDVIRQHVARELNGALVRADHVSALIRTAIAMMNKTDDDNNRRPARAASLLPLRRSIIGYVGFCAVFASFCLAVLPDSAFAQRMFDGNWSLLIVTEQGTCDRAYRYGVSIRSGQVHYDGGVVNFTGQVAANGNVSVHVTSGVSSAIGTGRLSRNGGRGQWSGQTGGQRCSGYWTAERRD
jgi:hypothetical protein